MPNWCEGDLRLRGEPKEIDRFIRNELEVCQYKKESFDTDVRQLKMGEEYNRKFGTGGVYFSIRVDAPCWIHVRGTQRAFIINDMLIDSYSIVNSDDDGHDVAVISLPVKQAWCLHVDDWIELASHYNLDFNIIAYEAGCEFEDRLKIVRGKEPEHECIEYDDWAFECACPDMGG